MLTKTNITIGLTILLTIFSFIPAVPFYIKLILGAIICVLLYFGAATAGEGLNKKVQVFINDVSTENKKSYKERLLKHLEKYGKTASLVNEEVDTIEVQVGTTYPIKTIQNSINKLPIKIDHISTVVLLKYTSIEAKGAISTVVYGKATPGSVVTLDGVHGSFNVGSDGNWSANIKISKNLLEKGYITGKAVKGKLSQDIKVNLG